MHARSLTLALLGCVFLAGCGTQGTLLGTEGEFVFLAYDGLATPGEEVALRARLQAGDLLRPRGGHVVRFYKDGQLYAAAVTNADGLASVSFTPERAGDYLFTAEPAPGGFEDAPPPAAPLRLACRKSDAPLVIVDLDKTLVASGFHSVLVGEPEPMPESPRVMKRLAEGHTIVYLTHRPDLFGPKSKAWLRRNGYPPSPVLLSDIPGFLSGSEAFKTGVLEKTQERFGNIRMGIGDKVSDAKAYHGRGIRAFLIVRPQSMSSPGQLRALADEIEKELPDQVDVVGGWDQVERAAFGEARFPRGAMVQALRDAAKAREKDAKDEGENE